MGDVTMAKDQPPCDPHIDVEGTLRKIEAHVATNEYHFRGQKVVESDGLLNFLAMLRQSLRCPSS
jgi:hypothetical protein